MARVKYDYKEGELGPRRWIDHHLKPVGVSTYVVQVNESGVGSSPTLTTRRPLPIHSTYAKDA